MKGKRNQTENTGKRKEVKRMAGGKEGSEKGEASCNLRSKGGGEKKATGDMAEKKQKREVATPGRPGRGRKKESDKAVGKGGANPNARRLEDFWKGEDEAAKGAPRIEREGVPEDPEDPDDPDKDEEEGAAAVGAMEEVGKGKEEGGAAGEEGDSVSEVISEEVMTEEEKERREEEEWETIRTSWSLPRTPVGGKGEGRQEDTEQGATGTQDVDLRQTDEVVKEQEQEGGGSGEWNKSVRSETGSIEVEELGFDRLERWMKKWERRQKVEWEERMADFDCLVRRELKESNERVQVYEKGGERRQESQLIEQLRETQDRLRECEDVVEGLRAEVKQWKGVVEAWEAKAEEQSEGQRQWWSKEGNPSAPGDPPAGRDDLGTCCESNRRVEGPGRCGELPERVEVLIEELMRNVVGPVEEAGNEKEDMVAAKGAGELADGIGGGEGIRQEGAGQGAAGQGVEAKCVNPPPRKMSEEEWRAETELRRMKRKNMFIEGLTLTTRTKKEELENWMLEMLDTKVRIEKLERKQRGGWIVRMEELAQKKLVMREKARLKELGWGVYITDDLTDRQKEVQAWLEREVANWRRSKKQVSTGYNSICVEGSWLEWDEQEEVMRQKGSRESVDRRGTF